MKNVKIINEKKPEIKGNILIIEDNDNCCLLIKEYLDLIFDLNHVNTTCDFVPRKIIKESSNIKLILINFKFIKSHNYKQLKDIHQNIPIIIINSDNSPKVLDKISNCGFDDVLLKPILATELISKVSKFI